MGMSSLHPVKLMLTKKDIEKIDLLVNEGSFASRADFGHKAVYLLLTALDGTQSTIKDAVSEGGKNLTS